MADPRGFLQVQRRLGPYRPTAERIGDYRDVHLPHAEHEVREQASRCMSCGVPFCHTGCPLGNLIPDWNDLVHTGRYREALEELHSTNNFPEFTGKLCPAPCEEACVLAINDDAVTIKEIEWAIVERGFEQGWIVPEPAGERTGRKVAVVGSGPAGLAAAQQLARAGHDVVVYERDDRAGGLLRYGIPDFKLEKRLIDQRLAQLVAESVEIRCGVEIGVDVTLAELRERFDAVLLATGAQQHRRLGIPGSELVGVHEAMDYLAQQNRRVAGLELEGEPITAAGKHVVILGGGDTSADCLGNALRESALSVTELAHGPTPPSERSPQRTWPEWPFLLRRYAAHEEGGERDWQVVTTHLSGGDRVRRLHGYRVEFPGFAETGRREPVPVPDGEITIDADLVLLAIGFTGVELGAPLYDQLGSLSDRQTVPHDGFQTPVERVYACGDCARGADLIVTAIADGREAARAIDRALTGSTRLPARAAAS